MLQLLLTLPSEAVQWKQLSHQLEKSPHPAPQPPRTSHDTSPPKQTEERQAGGPTSSPTGSAEGSSSSRPRTDRCAPSTLQIRYVWAFPTEGYQGLMVSTC